MKINNKHLGRSPNLYIIMVGSIAHTLFTYITNEPFPPSKTNDFSSLSQLVNNVFKVKSKWFKSFKTPCSKVEVSFKNCIVFGMQ